MCSEGEFRLVSQVLGNRFTVTGVLEVCVNGSICSDSVEFDDPMVQAQAEIASYFQYQSLTRLKSSVFLLAFFLTRVYNYVCMLT